VARGLRERWGGLVTRLSFSSAAPVAPADRAALVAGLRGA
jgi:hypothetical protein